jgi:HSP20 family protein
MKIKSVLLPALLVSSSVSAHSPFNHPFFSDGFHDNFWRDFHHQFNRMEQEFDRMKAYQNSYGTSSRKYFDKETNSYVLEMKLNGFTKDQVNVSTDNNMITIKASSKTESKSEGNNQQSSRSFSQSSSIPVDADTDNMVATFNDGVLKVSMPKLSEPKPKVRNIEIN